MSTVPLYKGFLTGQTPGVYTLDPCFDPKLVRKCGIRQHLSDSFEMVIDRVGEDSHEMCGHRYVVWRDHLCGQSDRERCHLCGDIRFSGDWDIEIIGKFNLRSGSYILTIVVLYPMGWWLNIWTISACFLEAGETSFDQRRYVTKQSGTHCSIARERGSSLGSLLGRLFLQPWVA
jgi:hypothetical protein